jgi:hypothetical protein
VPVGAASIGRLAPPQLIVPLPSFGAETSESDSTFATKSACNFNAQASKILRNCVIHLRRGFRFCAGDVDGAIAR